MINGEEYYSATLLKDYSPAYFYGCIKSPKKIVEKKKIPKEYYVYITENKTGVRVYTDDNAVPSKAVLHIKKKWVDMYIKKKPLCEVMAQSTDEETPVDAPSILFLEEEEMFKDDNGNPVKIETRGEREVDKVYFLVNDVAKCFDIPTLNTMLTDVDRSYVSKEDYVYFVKKDVEGRTNKALFLTYRGICKVLTNTRSVKANGFKKWASSVLCTVQLGKVEQKEELVANVLGVNVRSMRESLSTCATSVPCVYLFSLGTCKDLRKSMSLSEDIPDDYIIVKYGFTNDLNRRSGEHAAKYGKIDGVRLELLQYTYVDPIFLSNAENDICEFFKDIEIPVVYDTQKELVAVKSTHLKQVTNQYKSLNMLYAGRTKEMTVEIDRLKLTIERQVDKYKVELLEKELLIEKERQLVVKERHEKELLVERQKIMEERHKVEMKDMELKYLKMLMKKSIDVDDLGDCLSVIKL
jgi:hypothetical protein